MKKKKRFWIILILVILIVGVVIAGFIFRSRMRGAIEVETTVQEAVAEVGNVSTTVVGTGSIESGSVTDVVIPTGIKIKEVLVESGDVVENGQALATVDEVSVANELLEIKNNIEAVEKQIKKLSSKSKTEGTTEYLKAIVLNGQLEELEEAEDVLYNLLESKQITATCAGVISSVNVSANTEVTNSSGASVMGMSGETTLYPSEVLNLKISECLLSVEAPVTGAQPQTELAIEEGTPYTGSISWNCTTEQFQADTVYSATIKLTAITGYSFSENIVPEAAGAVVKYEILTSDDGNAENDVLRIIATFAKTAAVAEEKPSEDGEKQSQTGEAQKNTATAPKTSGTSGTAASSGAVSSGTADYNVYEAAAFSIASGDEVTISINIDELDVLSVKEGQTAKITVDVLENQEFEGTITHVTTSSTSNSSKYPVEITFTKTEDMLLGMSASATIYIDEAKDAVLIPVNALQEKGNVTFVYTQKDAEGNLSGEVEVETGLSNGSQVEILSGLKEGDTVYYLKIGSSDESGTGGFGDFGNMGGFGGFGGGEMPDMDNMPSGGGMPDMGNMPSGGGMPSGGSFPSGGPGSSN